MTVNYLPRTQLKNTSQIKLKPLGQAPSITSLHSHPPPPCSLNPTKSCLPQSLCSCKKIEWHVLPFYLPGVSSPQIAPQSVLYPQVSMQMSPSQRGLPEPWLRQSPNSSTSSILSLQHRALLDIPLDMRLTISLLSLQNIGCTRAGIFALFTLQCPNWGLAYNSCSINAE